LPSSFQQPGFKSQTLKQPAYSGPDGSGIAGWQCRRFCRGLFCWLKNFSLSLGLIFIHLFITATVIIPPEIYEIRADQFPIVYL
jgi:hypothetical protein